MPSPQWKNDQPTTYFVPDRQNKNELFRLAIQDQMITQAMGGVLSEQKESASIKRVLDIGCGVGSWIIEAAQTYPGMSLVGIDISPRMIEYAQKIASSQSINDRVTFQIMDALRPLEFADASFDLVNIRLGSSFMRTWDWPSLYLEMLRVLRPGGVVRIMESGVIDDTIKGAHLQMHQAFVCALFRSGHIFKQESTGLTSHLQRHLKQYGAQDVQTRNYELAYHAGTEEGEAYYENFVHLFQALRPFIQKWGCTPEDYDGVYNQAMNEIRRKDFCATWQFVCAWGVKRASSSSTQA
ncbi:MAG: methyltransferase domain-containing protein [Ktedonobacteraceae bacterium]|nr:methyltransferase domain-containing protein [Ktedonobacteraceae bacterium]